MLEITQ